MSGPFPSIGTISGIIDYGNSLDISHSKLHFKGFAPSNGRQIIINYTSVLDKYFDLITKNLTVYTMTDLDFQKYKFQPKLLSYDMYGTTELWSAILKVNNLFSASQFTQQTINIFNSQIFEILNEILILEAPEIKKNNSEIYKK